MKALKEKRDKESKLQKLRNPVAADGSIGISSQMSSMTKASDSSESDA